MLLVSYDGVVQAFCLGLSRHGGPLGRLYTQYGHKPWPALDGERTDTVLAISGWRWKRGE